MGDLSKSAYSLPPEWCQHGVEDSLHRLDATFHCFEATGDQVCKIFFCEILLLDVSLFTVISAV